MKHSLGIHVEDFTERYLGLPTAVERITSGTFDHICKRSRRKMQGWSEKNFVCSGIEVYLKLIIQSCMTKYWWSSSIDKRSLHWISWEKLATPKFKGGMGFRDFEKFNLALLGKQGWRLITHPDSLCWSVLKGKYFPECDFMQAQAPAKSSATWKAIIAGRTMLQTRLLKRVGGGSIISIWDDERAWCPHFWFW